MRTWCVCVALFVLGGTTPSGAVDKWGLKEGTPELASAGPLAFGPDGIVFVGDPQAAAILAIDTGSKSGEPAKVRHNIPGLNQKVAEVLGASTVTINDLASNPLSGELILSVSATVAGKATPSLVRVSATDQVSPLPLKAVAFARATLPNAPEDKVVTQGTRSVNRRGESITDLAFVNGKVLVAGLTSAAAPSSVRELAFPFADADQGTSIEIYHGAHGKYEDYAAVRAFVPFTIDGEPSILAGFTCTPLVKFPLGSFAPGKKVRGTTVAELGNRNRPLDMIVYEQQGKRFLLMANSARGVMKISTDGIGRAEGITEPVRGGGTAGQTYETIEALKGVVQLDKLNDTQAVVLVQAETAFNLQTIALP